MINHKRTLQNPIYQKLPSLGMSYKNTLIVGMALLGALTLLTGTLVVLPVAFAMVNPLQRTYGDPDERTYGDPNERIGIFVR